MRAVYLQRASREPDRFRVLDATRGVNEVTAQVCASLESLLGEPQ